MACRLLFFIAFVLPAFSTMFANSESGLVPKLVNIGLNNGQLPGSYRQNIPDQLDTLLRAGVNFVQKQEYDSAILCLQAGINISLREKIHGKELALLYKQLGGLHLRFANFATGIKFYTKAIEVAEKMGNDYLRISFLLEMSNAYIHLDKPEKALECYQKGRHYAEKNNNSSMLVRSLNSMGDLMRMKGELDSAVYFHHLALNEFEKENGNRVEYWALTSLGKIYSYKGECEKAQEQFGPVIESTPKIANYSLSSQAYLNMANCEKRRGNLDAAIYYGETAYEHVSNIADIGLRAAIARHLTEIYEQAEDYNKALFYHKIQKELEDSLNIAQQQKLVEQIAFKQKEKYLLKEVDKNNKLLQLERVNREAESKRFRNIITFASVAFVLVVLYVVFIYRSLQRNKRQRKTIQEQKKDILSSIQYAKGIQTAILPSNKMIKRLLPESFVLYLPKDIVAGDFYWMEEVDDKVIFAVADCTGHGVPGAMVSVVCHNAINRSVHEFKLTNPAEILNTTRTLLIDTFEKSDEEVNDGMDISLCVLDANKKQLKWAGANNNLWLVRNGSNELTDIKADRQPIGRFHIENSFTEHSLELQHGDMVYLYTDGYADQFGGESGKKFKSKRLMNLLLELAPLEPHKQYSRLYEEFQQWRAGSDQIDDVCIAGFKV